MSVIEMKPVRERILDAAIEQYYNEGIRAVSADKLIAAAHVSKVTFYRHFPTKDDLVAAYLESRSNHERDMILAKREELDDSAAVLRWYADLVGRASCSEDFRGCPFINAAAELSAPDHPGRTIIREHRLWLTGQLIEMLGDLGVDRAATRAEQLIMLRDGAMVSGYLGDEPEEVSARLIEAGRTIIGR